MLFLHFKMFRVGCAKFAILWMSFLCFPYIWKIDRVSGLDCEVIFNDEMSKVLAHKSFEMISTVEFLFPFSQLLHRRHRPDQVTPSATVARGQLQRSPCHSSRGVA